MKVISIYIIIAVSLCLFGCATPPVEEMENARNAVSKAANDENAVRYASGTLARARDALKDMEDAAQSKRYDDAKKYAEEAIAAADKAIVDGRSAADRAVNITVADSDFQASVLKEEIDKTSSDVANAQYRQLALDYASLFNTIENAYSTLDQAQVDNAAGRHQDAMDKAGIIRSALYNVNQAVANAAVSGRKK